MAEEKPQISRRTAVKIIGAAGVATVMASMRGWKKPSMTAGVLPAFAQASQGLGTGDFQATLTWNTGSTECGEVRTDIDLHVWEPNGTHVYYASPGGTTASLDVDNTCGFGPENIFVAPGNAASGTYFVGIVHYSGTVYPTTSTIRVRTFVDTPGSHSSTFTVITSSSSTSLVYPVAQAQFPSGAVSSWAGPVPAAFTNSMETSK
jgi:hypothetical protein